MGIVKDVKALGIDNIPQENLDKITVSVNAIITRNGNVLMMWHTKTNKLTLPGGKLEKGERPIEGLMRELREELNVTNVTVIEPPIITGGKTADLHVCYVIETPDIVSNLEKEKCHGLELVPINKIFNYRLMERAFTSLTMFTVFK